MVEVIIENAVQVVATLLMTLIGILGAWLTAKIGKAKHLQNISAAQAEVISMAVQTVEELQQTLVGNLKAANGGKLSEDNIKMLGKELINLTMKKMSAPTEKLLNAAGVDICALITGAGERYIKGMHDWDDDDDTPNISVATQG